MIFNTLKVIKGIDEAIILLRVIRRRGRFMEGCGLPWIFHMNTYNMD
jgi:hypothetical protein